MKLSLIQWNILYSEPIANIASFLKQNPGDIICLQELTINSPLQDNIDTPKFIAKELGYNYHHCEMPIHNPQSAPNVMLSNGIFCKSKVVSKQTKVLQKAGTSGLASDEDRLYIEVLISVGGKELKIGTTHLSYNGWFINNAKKQRESNNLIDIVKRKNQNYILSGDLNSRPNSYTIKNIKKHLKHAGPPTDQNTWTTKPFRIGNFAETELKWRLDYVFATPDVKILKSEIVKTEFSDHLPIRIEFEI